MFKTIQPDQQRLRARFLRKYPTVAQEILWRKLRCKRMCGLRFHRQKPKLGYFLHFYCPSAKLAIETGAHQQNDPDRDMELRNRLGILTLRFSDEQI